MRHICQIILGNLIKIQNISESRKSSFKLRLQKWARKKKHLYRLSTKISVFLNDHLPYGNPVCGETFIDILKKKDIKKTMKQNSMVLVN